MNDMTNLTQIGHNKWRIRFKYKDRLSNQVKPLKRVFTGTLAEARAERDRLKVEARNGELTRGSQKSRVKDWMPSFAEHRRDRALVNKTALRHTTLQRDHVALQHHILPEIEDWILEEVRPADVDDVVRRWRRKRKPNGELYANASVNTWLKVMKLLLRHCFQQAGLGPSPAENTAKLATQSDRAVNTARKGRGKGSAMSREQQHQFLAAARAASPYWYTFFLLGFTTGARLAGLTALRWEDVDWDAEELLFLQTQVDGIRYRGDKSHRQVTRPLVPRLAAVLRDHRQNLIRDQHPGVSTGLVFPGWKPGGKRGGHLSRSSVRKKMTETCEAAGIPRFTPHDMKRTFVTRMSELKVEKHVMKSMSAHSTDEMLYHYDDVATERKAVAVDLLFDTLQNEQG